MSWYQLVSVSPDPHQARSLPHLEGYVYTTIVGNILTKRPRAIDLHQIQQSH